MPRFDSPLGGKNFDTQPLREFDVPDESGPPVSLNANRRYQQMEEASNMNLTALQDFQNRMNMQQASQPPQNRQPIHPTMNDTDNVSVAEREFREMREAQRSGKSRLNDGAKRRIEMLLEITRSTRSVELESGIYVLQTLKAKEMREAIFLASKFDETVESPFEIRKQFLARSLIQIAGVSVEQFIGSYDLDSRMALIDELPEPLLNRLHKEYLLLVEDARKEYSIKSDADAKEVLEDLKK